MQRTLDSFFDWVILLVLLTITLPFMFWIMRITSSPEAGGFETALVEKSALKAEGEVVPKQRDLTRADILLMFLVADNNMPAPRVFKFKGGAEVFVDAVFLRDKMSQIAKISGLLPRDKTYKLILQYGPTGPTKWIVQEEN